MSVQLEALADEVFGAAAAQGRAGATSHREPFGEVVWNPNYPDLFFLNGVVDLMAPTWRATDLERALDQALPLLRGYRVTSRDPRTISTLGSSLTESGYHHEILVGMVETFTPQAAPPSPLWGGLERGYSIRPVDSQPAWSTLEELIRADTSEHDWTPAMTEQLIALYHWRAVHTPTRFFVAFVGEQPAGHAALFQHGATGYLHALFTLPPLRRRGVASALTLGMDREMRAMGAERLTLQCTDDGYLPAFYHRLGFRRVGEQHVWIKL